MVRERWELYQGSGSGKLWWDKGSMLETKERQSSHLQLYGRDGLQGTPMLKEDRLADTKKAQWLKELSAQKAVPEEQSKEQRVEGGKEILVVLEFK